VRSEGEGSRTLDGRKRGKIREGDDKCSLEVDLLQSKSSITWSDSRQPFVAVMHLLNNK